jgi:hypothetical protein
MRRDIRNAAMSAARRQPFRRDTRLAATWRSLKVPFAAHHDHD